MWKRLTCNPSDYQSDHTQSHLYHSNEWLHCLKQTYGFDFELIYDQDQLICAVCPLANAFGKRLISLPFSDYSPAVLKDTAYFVALLQFLQSEFVDYQIEFKTTFSRQEITGLIPYRDAVFHLINFTNTKQNKPSKNFLRGVKKAKKNELQVKINSDISAITTFYEIYKQLRFSKFNSIPQPISFFRNIHSAFIEKGNGYVYEAVFHDQVIASMIILISANKAYYKFGCSDPEQLHLKPNNLLFHQVIEDCKKNGWENLDLGLSGTSEAYAGLRRWKRDLGGIEYPITYYRNENADISDTNLQRKALKDTLGSLTGLIVDQDFNSDLTSKFSSILYPLFA